MHTDESPLLCIAPPNFTLWGCTHLPSLLDIIQQFSHLLLKKFVQFYSYKSNQLSCHGKIQHTDFGSIRQMICQLYEAEGVHQYGWKILHDNRQICYARYKAQQLQNSRTNSQSVSLFTYRCCVRWCVLSSECILSTCKAVRPPRKNNVIKIIAILSVRDWYGHRPITCSNTLLKR